MKKTILALAAILFIATSTWAQTTVVAMKTSKSEITLSLTGTRSMDKYFIRANETNLPYDGTETTVPVPESGVVEIIVSNAGMTSLNCSDNELTELTFPAANVSYNNFTELYCSGNLLAALDVSKCTKLTTLHCHLNKLTALNLSGCTALTDLDAAEQQVSVTKAPKALTYHNPITYCNLSAIEPIQIDGKKFTFDAELPLPATGNTLDFSTKSIGGGTPFSGTITLVGYTPPADTLATMTTTKEKVGIIITYTGAGTISANGTALTNGSYTEITPVDGKVTLTATGAVTLTSINCDNNQLTALDVSKCTALIGLSCNLNKLTALNVSANTNLENLYCYNNDISSLDLSGSSRSVFEELICSNNALTYLNLSGCTNSGLYMEANGQAISVSKSSGVYKNPVTYTNPTAVEAIKIGGTPYAFDANLPTPASGNTLTFTSTEIVSSDAFSGTITLEGLLTALDKIDTDIVKIYSTAGGIVIEGASVGEKIQLYNMSGMKIQEMFAEPETSIALNKGMYIVRIGNTVKKIGVK